MSATWTALRAGIPIRTNPLLPPKFAEQSRGWNLASRGLRNACSLQKATVVGTPADNHQKRRVLYPMQVKGVDLGGYSIRCGHLAIEKENSKELWSVPAKLSAPC